jgi:type VI secretion system secreted protein Hcp
MDDKHKDEIEVLSFSMAINNPRRGPVQTQEFVIVKYVDVATPSLFDLCCSGDAVDEATISVVKAGKGQEEYLKVVMSDVLVSSVTPVAGTGDALPTESVSFNYSKIEISYRPQKPDGSLGSWVTSSCSPRGRRHT